MGPVLIADVWLANLTLSNMAHREVAGAILSGQVLTYNKRGHLLDLTGEPLRKSIVHGVGLASITHAMVRCSRCGVQAPLAMWVRNAAAEGEVLERRKQVALENSHLCDPRYLEPCRGDEIVADLVEITGD